MTLKFRISLFISLLFSVLYGISAVVIYLLFADFRQDEFENRLKEKAYSSIKLLAEVKEVDHGLLKDLDRHTLNQLYDEKTLVFDANYKLIYSSIDDSRINWTVEDLKYLKENQNFFKKDGKYEVYGVFYDSTTDYYALISASDNYGKRKLEFLIYILLSTYIGFTAICWFATSYVVQRLLKPLDTLHNKIKIINENNLDTRIDVRDSKNEIDLIGSEFNSMLQRIAISYQKQKEFTAHASHELRTPIARISATIENKLLNTKEFESTSFLQGLLDDVNQVSQLISSLLLLARIENNNSIRNEDKCRIDEIIYDCFAKIRKQNPDAKLELDIVASDAQDDFLEVAGSKSLLEISFSNLLKNAITYSDNQIVNVSITHNFDELIVAISNRGETLDSEEQSQLFEAFMRGSNANRKNGLGLGLLIVHRIITQHGAVIKYLNQDNQFNVFELRFKY